MAGGVTDGQAVSAAVTNPAFIIKNADDNMPNNLGFTSTDPTQGSSVTKTQRFLNAVSSFLGVATSAVYNVIPSWTSNVVGASTDAIFTRVNLITALFKGSGGHEHTGADGDGPVIGASGGGTGQTSLQAAIDALASAGGAPSANQVLGYDGTHWVPSNSSGGGGGSLSWVEAANAPIPGVSSNILSYAFVSGLSQNLYALIKVPTSYPSTQIKMKLDFYSPDSSGNVLMQSVATLIRQGTDAITSTTNQRTSTNSAVTLGAGTVNIPQGVTLDLTDSSGKINGVSVSAGDYILVQLTRGTDTASSDVQVPVYGTEVTFV